MDLGIAGRWAIVCASSKGLGKGCALALAEAGCHVVVNGRDAARLEATAEEIRARPARKSSPSPATSAIPNSRGSARGLSGARHSRQQQRRAAARSRSSAITREEILRGLEANMLTPIALSAGGAAGHGAAPVRADHQHHLVFRPRADRRARRLVRRKSGPHRLSRGDRAGGGARQCDDQFDPAGRLRHRPHPRHLAKQAESRGVDEAKSRAEREAGIPGRTVRPARTSSAQFCAFLASAQAGYITGQNILIDGGAFPGAF